MQASDKRHFWEMLQGLAVSVKAAEVTVGMLKAYWLGLEDLALAAFDTAIKRAMRECDFFPSVKELRAFAGQKTRTQPLPHYFQPADNELERIETCQYHVKHGPAVVAPDYVPWCRKCKRKKLEAAPRGETRALGEVLETAGYTPQNGERR